MTADVITGIASFNPSTNKMKTGHHPVSFVYNPSVASAINGGADYVAPPTLSAVKLDKNSKMQCATCHDAHQNQTDDTQCYDVSGTSGSSVCSGGLRKKAPFWVYGVSGVAATDRDAVCLACHKFSQVSPNPYP